MISNYYLFTKPVLFFVTLIFLSSLILQLLSCLIQTTNNQSVYIIMIHVVANARALIPQ